MNKNTAAQTEQATIDTEEKTSLGAFRTSKALITLYNHAAPLLSDAELSLIADAVNHAQVEAEQMRAITEGLGCLIANDKDSGAFDNSAHILLWQLSNHLDLVSGLTWIGQEADFRLNNPDKAFPAREQPQS
jgi:hypothetical protein